MPTKETEVIAGTATALKMVTGNMGPKKKRQKVRSTGHGGLSLVRNRKEKRKKNSKRSATKKE